MTGIENQTEKTKENYKKKIIDAVNGIDDDAMLVYLYQFITLKTKKRE